ncbi:MAG: hypothetical protein AB1483_04740 [Candidatus Zixiibacteriota bacterium]
MRCTLLGVFSICLLVCAACGDKSVDPDTFTLPLTAFPHSIGTSWTYELTDSTSDGSVARCTVVVMIADSVAYDCGQEDCTGTFQQIWELQCDDMLDTVTVLYQHDSLHLRYPFVAISLFFPLELGKTWTALYPTGTTETRAGVVEITTLELNNDATPKCMIVAGTVSYDSGMGYLSIVKVAPNIGIAGMDFMLWIDSTIYEIGAIDIHQKWELIDWDVD